MEIVPENYFASLDLPLIYGRVAPLEVDLGCGDGTHLVELASVHPDRDFLGTERMRGRVRRTVNKIKALGLANARVFWIESGYAVQHLLPPESVTVFHLMFPDPWPKRRHQERRVVKGDFLVAIHRALIADGLFCVATDQVDYYREIESMAAESKKFVRVADPKERRAVSTFEKRFKQAGGRHPLSGAPEGFGGDVGLRFPMVGEKSELHRTGFILSK